MKNNLKKRILSLFLSVMMVIGMIPTASLTAFAAGDLVMNVSIGGMMAVTKITVKNLDGNVISSSNAAAEVQLNEEYDNIDIVLTAVKRGGPSGVSAAAVSYSVNGGTKTAFTPDSDKTGYANITLTPEWDDNGKYIAAISIDAAGVQGTYTLTFTAPTVSVAVTSVAVDKNAETIKVGATIPLSATVTYEDATTDSKVSWSSSDETVATVDANGVVTGKKEGTATITATTKGKDANGQPLAANCEITVEKEPVTAIALDKSEITVAVGYPADAALKATVTPDNATYKGVVWSSSDNNIATVDANGLVTGVSAGTATITAKSADNEQITAQCAVTVQTVAVESIALNKTKAELEIGKPEQLSVTFTPAQSTNKKVVWSSSDETVATVDANGVVTGIKATEKDKPVIITATTEDGGKTASCEVTVKKIDVTGISKIKKDNKDTEQLDLYLRDRVELKANVVPENATNNKINWTSSEPDVVSVDENGVITALAVGNATITAKSAENETFASSCNVKVSVLLEKNIATGCVETGAWDTWMSNINIKGADITDFYWNTTAGHNEKDVHNLSVRFAENTADNAKIDLAYTLAYAASYLQGTVNGPASITLEDGKYTATVITKGFKEGSNSTNRTYIINFTNKPNNAPTLADNVTAQKEVAIGEYFEIDPISLFTDADGDTLTITATKDGNPINVQNSYSEFMSEFGTAEFVFTATDIWGATTSHTMVVKTVAGETYDVNVNVPDAVTPVFYITKEFDSNSIDVLGSQLEAVKGTSENGFTLYTVKVPKNISRISYRGTTDEGVTNWGGMSFETKKEGTPITDTVILRQMQGVIKTLINDETPDAAQAEFKVKTEEGNWAVTGGTGVDGTYKYLYYRYLLVAYGNDAYYKYFTTAKGALAGTYGTNQSDNRAVYSESASVDVNVIPLTYKSSFTITAPTGADVKMYHQNNYYNAYEVTATQKTVKGDTTDWMFIKTNQDNMYYRVTMAGKITKAGYVSGDGITVQWDEDDIGPKDRVEYDLNTLFGTRADDSVVLNINARNNLVMNANDTFRLRAYRIWEIINSDTQNKIIHPDFYYNFIDNDGIVSVTPVRNTSGNQSINWFDIKANKNGVAIMEIGYDALDIVSGNRTSGPLDEALNQFTFNAVDPARTGLAVIQVGNAATDVSFNIDGNSKYAGSAKAWDAELDTLYFTEESSEITFAPSVANGSISEVAVSNNKGVDWTVLDSADGTYTAKIVIGNNIIRVKTDHGDSYQIVRGDKLNIEFKDTDGDGIAEAGETVTITITGLHTAIPKMSGVYNPSAPRTFYTIGGKEVQHAYQQHSYAYSIFDIAIPAGTADGTEFALTNGYTNTMCYGDAPGNHRNIPEKGLEMNGNAEKKEHIRNILPDISFKVGEKIGEETVYVPNTAPTLKAGVNATDNTATVEVGGKFELNLKDVFTDAENDKLTYKVTVDGKQSEASAAYNYVPAKEGEYVFVFTANDGEFDSESYTVTLTVNEAAQINPDLVFDIDENDIIGYVTISLEDNAIRLENEIERIDVIYQKPLGTIIKPVKVPFAAYDTIAEVTLRLFKAMDIKANYQGDAYSGFYLASIGNFIRNNTYYESMGQFSAGQGSGWMITWNTGDEKGDWFINKGASDFVVNDGDIIKWKYTCQYGADIGDKGYLEEAKDAEKLIAAIGTPITLESEAAINEARSAYDALVPAQRAAVSNYDVLVAAEKALALLKATSEDKAAAETVNGLISAIGTVTKESKAAIEAARAAYDSLENDVQKQLCDIEILETAENLYKQLINGEKLEEIYNDTGDYIASLGTPAVGTTGGEWMVIGLARGNKGLDAVTAQGYLNGVMQYMENEFSKNVDLKTAVRLDVNKSTENSRVIIGLTAAGFDATNVNGYNLFKGLNDMEYIKYQGVNGPIWALIALNSHPSYKDELRGNVTEEKLIEAVLSSQLSDSGWDLANTAADTDMTAMAIQALAPYYDSNTKVKEAVDKALSKLSSMQQTDGSFASIDGKNSESIAQVIVALTALGINSEEDARFIKKGISAVDALCEYAVSGGGFMHTPGTQLDGMSTEQSYYALVSYFRLLNPNQTSLYDMSDVTLKKGVYDDKVASAYDEQVVSEVEKLINDIGKVEQISYYKIEKARKAYDKLNVKQKKLVDNYNKLLEAEDEAVDQVEDLIDKIGEVGYDSSTDVEAAKKAYNYLPEYLKKKVSNYDKLNKAEITLKDLRAEALELIKNGKLVLSKSELLELKGDFEEITENTGYDAVLALMRTYARLGEKQQLALKNTDGFKLAQKIIADYNHEDASTGITTDDLEWNVRLVVEDVANEIAEKTIESSLENSAVIKHWDIYLEDVLTGEKYIAEKTIRIKVPAALIGDWTAYDELCAVHYTDKGEIEVLKCSAEDEYISFNAAEFSVYAVVGIMNENSQSENHPAFTVPNGAQTNTGVTDVNSGWIIWVIIAAVGAIALAVLAVMKKRTKDEE